MQEGDEKKSKIISILAKNVRFLVSRSGLTQKKYAETLDCSEKSFSGYVNGVADFPTELFMKIAAREGYNPADLFQLDISTLIPPMPKAMRESIMVREPESQNGGYERERPKDTIDKLADTIRELVLKSNDLPALREELERLKNRVAELEKGNRENQPKTK